MHAGRVLGQAPGSLSIAHGPPIAASLLYSPWEPRPSPHRASAYPAAGTSAVVLARAVPRKQTRGPRKRPPPALE